MAHVRRAKFEFEMRKEEAHASCTQLKIAKMRREVRASLDEAGETELAIEKGDSKQIERRMEEAKATMGIANLRAVEAQWQLAQVMEAEIGPGDTIAIGLVVIGLGIVLGIGFAMCAGGAALLGAG